MNNKWVEEALNNMTVEERVGQLLMVCFFEMNEQVLPEILERMKKYHIGGYFHFHCPQETFVKCVETMQNESKIPLLVCGDHEVSIDYAVDEGITFPRPMARGHLCDEKTEYEIGKIIAQHGRALGINMTFSPVVDVNTNRLNPDVNIRAYSDDQEIVSKLAVQYIKGLQENGMLATAKHFPGNGGSEMDPHISTAYIPFSREEMEKVYLLPYKRAFEETDCGAIMVTHLEVPSLVKEINPKSGRPVPASLSKEVLLDLCRKEMGFRGLIVTDALNMGGITTHYTRQEASVKAIQAGVDMLLVFNPEDFEIDYEAILEAAKSGALPVKRLDDAVRNVLNAKAKLGIDKDRGMPASKEVRDEILKPGSHDSFCISIAEKAITVLRNNDNLLPVRDIKGKKVALLHAFSPENNHLINQGQPPIKEIISEKMKEKGAEVETYEITSEMATGELKEIIEEAAKCDYIFINFFIIPSWGIGTMIPNRNALRLFMFSILAKHDKVVFTSFGDPYVMFYCPAAPVSMCTFGEDLLTQETAVKAWLGEIPIRGRMPVRLEAIYERGDGLDIG